MKDNHTAIFDGVEYDTRLYEVIGTLDGPKLYMIRPKCFNANCSNPADNAGNGRWHKYCSLHHRMKYNMKNGKWLNHRKDFCENVDGRLGFTCTSTILISEQLEVDHKDGDKANNTPENLQTLCACCHRVKTYNDRKNYNLRFKSNDSYQDFEPKLI